MGGPQHLVRAMHTFKETPNASPESLPGRSAATTGTRAGAELPMTVKEAARFLGVSSQTVYVWVERKRIPHLRVMGRNIRFLESDLQSFRAQFRQEVENAKTE